MTILRFAQDKFSSTSLTTDKDGVPVAQARYLPYGQERWITGILTTDFTFTGQWADETVGTHARV